MALIYFAVSLFVSAFLLFLVQPMIGKMILPRLGGTPQVWNTCMMFFQMALLAGYAYSHNVTSKLHIRRQLLTHCLVLLLPLPVLLAFGRPFSVTGFGAEGGGNPIWATLALLTMIVGLPFLVVSTTAPLLQRWFHNTGHPAAKDPYFLYGASNLGSILGLILYPVGVEYYLGLDAQAWFWLGGYIVLIFLVGGCALFVLKAPPAVELPGVGRTDLVEESLPEMPMPEPASTAVTATPPVPSVQRTTAIRRGGKRGGRGSRGPMAPAVKDTAINIKKSVEISHEEPERPYEVTPLRRLRWVGLAAVPTSLMLGTTTYISTDISPVPLLWIIPLTLYLLSFVLVFLRWPVPWVGVGRSPRDLTAHKIMVVLQLAALAFLVFTMLKGGGFQPISAMLTCWGAFFLTALVCHGELARDRPPAKDLTQFYLWMSVGGMVGGVFNALIAPLVPWWGLFEFPLALVFACLVRPGGKGKNLTDFLLEGMPKEQTEGMRFILDIGLAALLLLGSWLLIRQASAADGWNWKALYDPREQGAKAENLLNPLYRFASKTLGFSETGAYSLASVLFSLLTFGLLIGLALLTWKRPTRLALCLGAVLLGGAFYERGADERTLYRDRSYFGLLKVLEDRRDYTPAAGKDQRMLYRATSLLHGTTHHGLNYQFPDKQTTFSFSDGSERTLPDMTRLATTYYHRDGPVGAVMEKLNWFPGMKTKTKDERLTFWGDARLPTSLIGAGVPGFGVNFPMAQIVSAWSDPPYATIGLGTGTMASYARPFQHVTFYEIDEHIRNFSLPPKDRETFFGYVQGAIRRGAKFEIVMGDARLTMTKEMTNTDGSYYLPDYKDSADRKSGLGWKNYTSYPHRQNYYRAMEVDAFSSDAIPVHLITKEAIEMYMDKLMPNGVLLVHTSNRHVNLVQPVLKICEEAQWRDWTDLDKDGNPKVNTGLKWVICKDDGAKSNINIAEPSKSGHFSSEYVLVARKQEYLPPYALTPEQEKTYGELGIYAVITEEQKKKYEEAKLPYVETTITFLTPRNIEDSQYRRIVEFYGYFVPPGTRTWTDDYSNVLSVFRWR